MSKAAAYSDRALPGAALLDGIEPMPAEKQQRPTPHSRAPGTTTKCVGHHVLVHVHSPPLHSVSFGTQMTIQDSVLRRASCGSKPESSMTSSRRFDFPCQVFTPKHPFPLVCLLKRPPRPHAEKTVYLKHSTRIDHTTVTGEDDGENKGTKTTSSHHVGSVSRQPGMIFDETPSPICSFPEPQMPLFAKIIISESYTSRNNRNRRHGDPAITF